MINAEATLHLKFYSTEGGWKTFCFWQKSWKLIYLSLWKCWKTAVSCKKRFAATFYLNFSNGQYSGQICLFLPMSQVLAKLISALFLHTYEAHMRGNGAPSSVQGIKKPWWNHVSSVVKYYEKGRQLIIFFLFSLSFSFFLFLFFHFFGGSGAYFCLIFGESLFLPPSGGLSARIFIVEFFLKIRY